MVFLALVYFTSTTLYEKSLDEDICTCPLGLRTRLFSGQVQNSVSYHNGFYSAILTFFNEVKSAATALGQPLSKVFVTQVPVFGF